MASEKPTTPLSATSEWCRIENEIIDLYKYVNAVYRDVFPSEEKSDDFAITSRLRETLFKILEVIHSNRDSFWHK